MKQTRDDQKQMELRQLHVIAAKMFTESPVWENVAFEDELRRRWEKQTGTKVDDSARIKSGRTRWRNLCDWVKANHTRQGLTLAFTLRGREYRIWYGVIGRIDVEDKYGTGAGTGPDSVVGLVRAEHLVRVARALVQIAAETSPATSPCNVPR